MGVSRFSRDCVMRVQDWKTLQREHFRATGTRSIDSARSTCWGSRSRLSRSMKESTSLHMHHGLQSKNLLKLRCAQQEKLRSCATLPETSKIQSVNPKSIADSRAEARAEPHGICCHREEATGRERLKSCDDDPPHELLRRGILQLRGRKRAIHYRWKGRVSYPSLSLPTESAASTYEESEVRPLAMRPPRPSSVCGTVDASLHEHRSSLPLPPSRLVIPPPLVDRLRTRP